MDKKIEVERKTLLADIDGGPTKIWMMQNRTNAEVRGAYYYDLGFAKRPGEELFDLRTDPGQINNVAHDPKYAADLKGLSDRLMKLLNDANDPRVTDDGSTFDKPPYTAARKN